MSFVITVQWEIRFDPEFNGGFYGKDYDRTKAFRVDNSRSGLVCHGLYSGGPGSD
jgi:hypothetical protein